MESKTGVMPEGLRHADLLSGLLEAITDAFVAVNRDWKIAYINSKAAEWLETTPDRLIGADGWLCVPGLSGTDAERHLRDAMADRKPRRFEYFDPFVHCWFEAHAVPIETGLGVFFQSIHERKRLEAKYRLLNETGRRLSSTLDPQLIFAALEDLLPSAMACNGIVVSSYNETTGLITCDFCWAGGEILDASALPPIPINREGKGMQSQVILSGEARIFLDLAEKSRERGTTLYQVRQDGTSRPITSSAPPVTQSAIMAPLKLEGRVVGVLQVMSDTENAYSDEHLDLLEGLAVQVGMAVQNARLYQQAQREVEERRRTEAELEAREDTFRQEIDSMPNMAWALDADHAIEYFNRQYIDYTGAGELSNWGVVHPDDRERVREGYLSALNSGQVWECEMRLRRRDGAYLWHLSRLVPIRDASGKIVRWFGTSTNVHELKSKENLIRFLFDLGEHTRMLVEPTQVMATVTRMLAEHLGASRCAYAEVEEDGDHFVIDHDYSVGCQSILGRYRLTSFGARAFSELRIGKPFVVCDVDRELQSEDLAAYRQTEIQAIICVSLVKNGRLAALMAVHQTTPRSWTPEEVQLVSSVADRCWSTIERARSGKEVLELNADLERRVRGRTAELEDAVRELEGFTYTVSHDLRAPLRAINATSNILQADFGGVLPPEAREQLDRQIAAANRLSTLIDELLHLSRLGRQEMKRKRVDLSALAEEAVTDLEVRKAPPGLRFEVEPGLTAVADPVMIRFVLQNLLENAWKFSPQGGVVRVGQTKDGAFFVADEGIGFEEKYAHKMFLPFERLVTEREFPGTGIGLANVARIIGRHGGNVWATGEPGKGATFYFTLGE